MENASKALLMAASVLVGIGMISLAIYLYTVFGDYGSQIAERIQQKETDEFNAQFYKYESYKDENGNWQNTCKASDIISIANLAKNNNNNYDFGTEDVTNNDATFYITVDVKPTKDATLKRAFEKEENYSQFLKDYVGFEKDGKYIVREYTCQVDISSTTGRVKRVTFIAIN